MVNKERQDLKEGCIDSDKPATIHIDVPGGDVWAVDATHHIINDGVVSVYIGTRSDGIDIQTDISRCVIDRRTRNSDADKSKSASESVNEKPRVMTDGGRDMDVPPCPGCGADLIETARMGTTTLDPRDINRARPVEMPTATCDECGTSVGAQSGQRAVHALVDVLGDPRCDTDDDEDGGEDPHADDASDAIDAGRNVSKCTECDALIDAAELCTGRGTTPGRNPGWQPAPDVNCGECGASVGATHGMQTVIDLFEARGEPIPGRDENDDQDHEEGDQELVTDGGQDFGLDSDDFVAVEAPRSRFVGPGPKFQTFIYVSVGDEVIVDNHVCRVTAVRKTMNSDGTQDVEIDIKGLVFEAMIRDGIWRCRECERVSVEPRGDSCQKRRCSICRSEAERERRRRRREEWEQEVQNAILTDPADSMTGAMRGVPEWREELSHGGDA